MYHVSNACFCDVILYVWPSGGRERQFL